MSLDIIIPSLNEANNLKILLPYLKQHLSNNNSNIIVVDAQQSADNTEDICRQNTVSYQKSNFNQRAAQLNQGAGLSSADHLLFLHADVKPPTTFESEINDRLRSEIDFGFFAYTIDSPKLMLKINSHFTQYDMVMAGGGDQCHFMTRACYDDLVGYNESYNIMEDFELFDRIKKNSINYGIIKSKAIVSDRKYNKYSWLRVNLINLIVFTRYKMGTHPDKLKKICARWLG